jgi:hypothetical protein
MNNEWNKKMTSHHAEYLLGRSINLQGAMWHVVGIESNKATPTIGVKSFNTGETRTVSLKQCIDGLVADEAIDLEEPAG